MKMAGSLSIGAQALFLPALPESLPESLPAILGSKGKEGLYIESLPA